MNKPIFESVWDALRFSFYMEAIPAGVPSSTWTAIKSLMKNSGRVFDRVQSRVHMKGLTPLEVRGQCAMVRDCVEENLLKPEIYSIWACHGVDATQHKGIIGLASYIQHLTLNKGECLEWIVAMHYTKVVSIREIAKNYSVTKSSVGEDVGRVRAVIGSIEKISYERLDVLLKRNSLVLDENSLINH